MSATRPVSCIRASMIPVSPASLPSEYCWYSPCRSYIRYTPSSLSTTSRSSPVQPNRMIFACSHCAHPSACTSHAEHRGSIHTEQQKAFAGGGVHLDLRLRERRGCMAERDQLRRITHESYYTAGYVAHVFIQRLCHGPMGPPYRHPAMMKSCRSPGSLPGME